MESSQENHKKSKDSYREAVKKIEESALVKAAIENNNIQHIGKS